MLERKLGNFLTKLLELYDESISNGYKYMLDADGVRELLSIYVDEYIPMEKLGLYEQDDLIRMMMKQMTAIYKLEVAEIGKNPDLTEVVINVSYKEQKMYIQFKRIAPLKYRRLRAGLSQTQLADKAGYKLNTIERCELPYCDMSKQPRELLERFAQVLECEEQDLI